MNLDELFDQHRAKNIFEHTKKVRDIAAQDVELIVFTFANVIYNKNRIIEERLRMVTNGNIPEQMKEALRESVHTDKVEIPFPLEADIVLFELHSFLFNVIRTLNFMVSFTIENVYGRTPRKLPTAAQFTRRNHRNDKVTKHFVDGNKKWFGEVNTLRNIVAHHNIVELMSAKLIAQYNTSKDGIEHDAHISLETEDIKMPDVCLFCEEVTDKLEEFIVDFFVIVENMHWEPQKGH